MKKTFVAVVLCMALLSSFTVFASAEFTSTDSSNLAEIKKQVQSIRDQLGYPPGGFSSLRDAVNHIANNLPSSPKDYSTVLSNIYSNTSSISSTLADIYGVNSGLVQRVVEIGSEVMTSNQHLGTISSSLGTIDSHIGSGFELNHSDLTSFAAQNHSDFNYLFNTVLDPLLRGSSPTNDGSYRYPLRFEDGSIIYVTWGNWLLSLMQSLTLDIGNFVGGRSIYGLVSQLQQVLASDDDLQLNMQSKERRLY